MTGYNHYADCSCGWCRGGGRSLGIVRSGGDAAFARVVLGQHGYKAGSYSSCFVNPNARCPVCDASVFYYANAQGSRVFFNDLGPPWEKHACTDRGRDLAVRVPTAEYPPLARRKRGIIGEIFNRLDEAGTDPRLEYLLITKANPQSIFRADATCRIGFANYVRATELVGGDGDVAYFKFDSANYYARTGDIFSTDGVFVTFRDLIRDQVKKLRATVITAEEFDDAGPEDE